MTRLAVLASVKIMSGAAGIGGSSYSHMLQSPKPLDILRKG